MSTAVLFQTMPPLSVDEYANLEQSIRTHGIQVPIIVDEDGVVIDGHHRQKIAESLDVECPVEVKYGMTDVEKRSLSVSLNIDRRQLSREQRRAIVASSIKADPDLTDREHARRVGVSPSTVGAVRADLEETGDVSKLDTRIDSLGRQQPASKPPVTKITETHKEETFWDASTGEEIAEPVADTAPASTPARRHEPKPVLHGEAAAQLNREEAMQAFSRAIFTMWQLTYPSHRNYMISEVWPLASDAVPPDAQEQANPEMFRAIAVALNQLADEWEK